jgi:hypothetical protein
VGNMGGRYFVGVSSETTSLFSLVLLNAIEILFEIQI